MDRTTPEVKEARASFCTMLVDDPAYQKKFRARLLSGKMAPAVECMIWHYAKGKPKETHDVSGRVEFSWMTE